MSKKKDISTSMDLVKESSGARLYLLKDARGHKCGDDYRGEIAFSVWGEHCLTVVCYGWGGGVGGGGCVWGVGCHFLSVRGRKEENGRVKETCYTRNYVWEYGISSPINDWALSTSVGGSTQLSRRNKKKGQGSSRGLAEKGYGGNSCRADCKGVGSKLQMKPIQIVSGKKLRKNQQRHIWETGGGMQKLSFENIFHTLENLQASTP